MATKIEWAEETWNPIIGCSKVSPGCNNCYAERMAVRLAHMEIWRKPDVNSEYYYPNVIVPQKGSGWNGNTRFVEPALHKPLKWKKPKTIFICSMGDLFHESVQFEWISKVFSITQKCKHHTFLVLTKRPERMLEYFIHMGIKYPYLNVWLGVTAENKEQADKRIPILLQIPAAKRFVSIEPMLSKIDISEYLKVINESGFNDYGGPFSGRDKLDWVICGGESGPGARPVHPDWVRSIRDQCRAVDTPFMFKQWGEWHETDLDPNPPKQRHLWPGGKLMARYGKKAAGRELDGQIWNQTP